MQLMSDKSTIKMICGVCGYLTAMLLVTSTKSNTKK